MKAGISVQLRSLHREKKPDPQATAEDFSVVQTEGGLYGRPFPGSGAYIIQNSMRNRSTIEFIGLWEQIHNPTFKGIEFDAFKIAAGSNSFTLTP